MADYISQTDLEHAITRATVKAAFDEGDNEADPDAVAACIAYANAECNSFLRKVLVSGGSALSLPLVTVPDEVKFAALEFGIAYAIRRKPDVAKAMGVEKWSEFHAMAVARMKRYCESEQRVPTTTAEHGTAGAALLNPDVDEDGATQDPPDEGRWVDMGGFS